MTIRSTSRFLTELFICCHRDFESFYCSYLKCVMYQVVSSSSAPEWSQEFAWAFDNPPKGQKLRISCKSKNAFGKASLCLCMCRVILFGFYGSWQRKRCQHGCYLPYFCVREYVIDVSLPFQGSLGKVTIQIDRVVMLGKVSGQYTLVPDTNRDGSSRKLDIEFQWSNK